MPINKYIAELLGAFALSFAVLVTVSGAPVAIPTALIAALTLGLFVYTVGPVSGAHLNPAVTVGALSIGKIKLKDAVLYVVAQFIGAWLAWFIATRLSVPLPQVLAADNLTVGFGELLGTFFFTFGIASVIYGTVPRALSGAVVGGSLLLGSVLAAVFSNGILNPAVALGVGSFSYMYVVGPLLGSVFGMWAFKTLAGSKAE